MTEQFDEGVKEILASLIIVGSNLGFTAYKINDLRKQKQDISPLDAIAAIEKDEEIIDNPSFDKAAEQAKEQIKDIQKPVLSADPVSKIYNRLKRGGLTRNAVLGILANLKAESEFNPGAMQIGGGPGRGLAQWEKGGRFDTDRINLVKFAKKKGKKWTDLDTQVDFILYELSVHPEYKRVKIALNNSKTPEQAMLIFLRKYEKAGIPHTGKRLKFLKDLKNKL